MIDPDKVHEAMMDCLYKNEELPKDGSAPEGCVVVEGILSRFGLHPDRLESHRKEVATWLLQLPVEFWSGGGGGWSFLNGCVDRDGEQWTSFQTVVGELFVLAIGLGLAEYQLPREVWSALPGGVPYIVVFEDKCTEVAV